MSKLKIACLVLGIAMLLSIIFFQVIKPLSPQNEWENVNTAMANMLQLESSSHVVEKPKQQSKGPKIVDKLTEAQIEAQTENQNIETQIVIPTSQPSQSNMININSATLEQLVILPGIGPSKAEAIIDYRTKYGEFRSLEQIMEVKGIGPKIFEKMKERISITKES